MGLPLACVPLLSRQCRVLWNLPAPWPSWRAVVALPRRFGRVCWDLAAMRRGADRLVPLPIRIACSTGNFQSDENLLGATRTIFGAPPGPITRVRGELASALGRVDE